MNGEINELMISDFKGIRNKVKLKTISFDYHLIEKFRQRLSESPIVSKDSIKDTQSNVYFYLCDPVGDVDVKTEVDSIIELYKNTCAECGEVPKFLISSEIDVVFNKNNIKKYGKMGTFAFCDLRNGKLPTQTKLFIGGVDSNEFDKQYYQTVIFNDNKDGEFITVTIPFVNKLTLVEYVFDRYVEKQKGVHIPKILTIKHTLSLKTMKTSTGIRYPHIPETVDIHTITKNYVTNKFLELVLKDNPSFFNLEKPNRQVEALLHDASFPINGENIGLSVALSNEESTVEISEEDNSTDDEDEEEKIEEEGDIVIEDEEDDEE